MSWSTVGQCTVSVKECLAGGTGRDAAILTLCPLCAARNRVPCHFNFDVALPSWMCVKCDIYVCEVKEPSRPQLEV